MDFSDYFEKEFFLLLPFEFRIYIVLGLLAFVLIFIGAGILYRSVLNPSKSKEQNSSEDKSSTFRKFLTKVPNLLFSKRFQYVFCIVIMLIAAALVYVTIIQSPKIIRSTPEDGDNMRSAQQEIEVEFTVPVDKSTVEFNLSPETPGDWIMEESSVPGLDWVRKAKFVPEESIYPGRKVVVYVVGKKTPWSNGKQHEESLEFRSPDIPEVESISPSNDSKNVPVDKSIEVNFDSDLGKFVDIEYEIAPEVEFEISDLEENKDKQNLKFNNELSQDQKYNLKIFRTLRSYRVDNNENIEVGEREKIEEINFETVTTPLVDKYSPKGNTVRADSVIEVVFDNEMKIESVEEKFSITPETEGDISWKDKKTFVFTPSQDLKKETEYKVVFEKGLLNEHSGETNEKIEIKFSTVGRVKVAGFSPANGSYGIDPSAANVVVTFNQEVDKESAQQKFSISPSVNGSFGWNGNQMTYFTAGKLAYSTRYRVSVGKGVKTVYGIDSEQDFSSSFVTKDQIITLGVPYYSQQEMFSCNIAAARMALAYRGVYVSESQIKSGVGVGQNPNADFVPGYGVHAGPIASYMGRYRNVSLKSGWDVTSLAREVEAGNPVIVWWYNRYSRPSGAFSLPGGYTGYNGMHSEVVYGFSGNTSSPNYFYTNDPWRGRLTYSNAGFRSTWAYMNYTAIVVY